MNDKITKIDEINLTFNILNERLPFIHTDDISMALDILKGSLVKEICNKETITPEDFEIINNLLYNTNTHYAPDIYNFITTVLFETREKTKGSCILKKIFISENLYKSITKQANLSENTVLNINKVGIYINPTIKDDDKEVFGLCSSKFNNMPYYNLLIRGRLLTKGKGS